MNNILITSAGRRVSLVRMFKKELKRAFPDSKLYTADSDPLLSAACYESDGAFKVIKNDAAGYVDELLALAIAKDIKIIIPTIDTGLKILSESKDTFSQHGITLLTCSSEFVTTCRDKRRTSDFFFKS